MLMASLICSILLQDGLLAQSSPLTLGQAVEQSIQKYPAVRSSLEQVDAAAAAINLARTSYLPRADFLGQVNRATHNNVFGQLLPQSVIPSMSGPVLNTNSLNSVWASAAGTLVSWEPFDFGLRRANVEIAKATRERKAAEVSVTKLQVATAAADAFLSIAAAQQTVVAAQAGVDRSRVLNQVLESLVKNELRPGADASRTRAELALAQTQQIQAEQALDVARAELAQLLGSDPKGMLIEPGRLLELPSDLELPAAAPTQHPLAIARNAEVNEVKSRETALNRSYFPKFNLQAASFARGTGITVDGRTGGEASGLAPNVQNWALGASVTFPAFDWFSIHARKEIEFHNERSASASYDQTLQDLTAGVAKAKAVLDGARRVAQNTPIQLQAARDTEQQATARYKAGLGNIAEVAEAQRLLTQAEIDNSLAKLGVWRAMLGVAAAEGDLTPFLAAAGK